MVRGGVAIQKRHGRTNDFRSRAVERPLKPSRTGDTFAGIQAPPSKYRSPAFGTLYYLSGTKQPFMRHPSAVEHQVLRGFAIAAASSRKRRVWSTPLREISRTRAPSR